MATLPVGSMAPRMSPRGAGRARTLTAGAPLLEIRGLDVGFRTSQGLVRAVNGVDLDVRAGEIVGLVGESGSGKSVTSRAVMGLLPRGTTTIRGSIRLDGDELVGLSEHAYRRVRGERVAMIFQDPMTALDPLYRAGDQVAEALRFHFALRRDVARARVRDLFANVGLAEPDAILDAYPHQLSGGMRQRVMIAMALACEPGLLIADEPTTALDVTIQAQILELLKSLQQRLGMGVVMITHDLGVVAECCDRVVVMYAGKKVEEASVADLFDRPLHPYTRALMASMPSMQTTTTARLTEIPGMVPSPHDLGQGCAFAPRCALASARCRAEAPALEAHGDAHLVACFAVERSA